MKRYHQRLLRAHKNLDAECRNRNGKIFISDWYCDHPFLNEIIPIDCRGEISDKLLMDYYFQNDHEKLRLEILQFHKSRTEMDYSIDNIFVSSGLTPLITSQMILLLRKGVKKIFYLKPLYYIYYFLADTFGIELIPVNDRFDITNFKKLSLPNIQQAVLIMSDPIWCTGSYNSSEVIEAIRSWQKVTKSIVIVDGAFQYQRWSDNYLPESTSTLLTDFTIRNVCPTKSVAIHGPRFAYAILPKAMYEEQRYCYSNSCGSGSAFDFQSSLSIMEWLNKSPADTKLLRFIQNRYNKLVESSIISDPIGASASYFCFIEKSFCDDCCLAMDQAFFDLDEYPGMVRFNILLRKHELTRFIDIVCEYSGIDPTSNERLKNDILQLYT